MPDNLYFVCFDYINNGKTQCYVQTFENKNMAIVTGYSVNGHVFKMDILSGVTYLSLFERLATRIDIGKRKHDCRIVFEDESRAKEYFGYTGLLSDYLAVRFESTAKKEGEVIKTDRYTPDEINKLIDHIPLDEGISPTNLKLQVEAAKELNEKHKPKKAWQFWK